MPTVTPTAGCLIPSRGGQGRSCRVQCRLLTGRCLAQLSQITSAKSAPHRAWCRSEFSSTEAHSSALPPLAVPVSMIRSGAWREARLVFQRPPQGLDKECLSALSLGSPAQLLAAASDGLHSSRQRPINRTWTHIEQQHLNGYEVKGVLHHGEACGHNGAGGRVMLGVLWQGAPRPCPAVQAPPTPQVCRTHPSTSD